MCDTSNRAGSVIGSTLGSPGSHPGPRTPGSSPGLPSSDSGEHPSVPAAIMAIRCTAEGLCWLSYDEPIKSARCFKLAREWAAVAEILREEIPA